VSFLRERQVPMHEPISWIDGTVVDERKNESGRQMMENIASDVNEDIDTKIVRLYREMKAADKVSLSQIQRDVYGDVNTGGAHFRHIQDLIGQIGSATTAENMPKTDFSSSSTTPATA
jgi:hypothetical protein